MQDTLQVAQHSSIYCYCDGVYDIELGILPVAKITQPKPRILMAQHVKIVPTNNHEPPICVPLAEVNTIVYVVDYRFICKMSSALLILVVIIYLLCMGGMTTT